MFIGIFRNIFRSWATTLFVLKVQRSYFGRIARFLQGNRLISKEIRQTFTIEKNWCSQNFDFLENKCLFWHYHLQLSFIYKTVPQISFNLFCSGDKRILAEFDLSKVDFTDIINVSPYLGWKLKFRKTESRFCKWRSNDCYWKILVPFCSWKKRPEKAFLALTVNNLKTIQKKKYVTKNNSKLTI